MPFTRFSFCVCVYCRKAEIEVLFDKSSCNSLNVKVATEAQVLVKHARICILLKFKI